MKMKNVNLSKMERMAVLAFKNALRLHFDSILLYKKGSAPSAYHMSILALEELGKYEILDDFIYHSRIDGRFTPDQELEIIKSIYNHRVKQNCFVGFHIDYEYYSSKMIQEIFKGKMEMSKQNAAYVGLPRKNSMINLHGKIQSPFKIKSKVAEKQITLVNDTLLLLTLGFLKGTYAIDILDLEKYLTMRLLNKLKRSWTIMRSRERRRFEALNRLPNDDEDD